MAVSGDPGVGDLLVAWFPPCARCCEPKGLRCEVLPLKPMGLSPGNGGHEGPGGPRGPGRQGPRETLKGPSYNGTYIHT